MRQSCETCKFGCWECKEGDVCQECNAGNMWEIRECGHTIAAHAVSGRHVPNGGRINTANFGNQPADTLQCDVCKNYAKVKDAIMTDGSCMALCRDCFEYGVEQEWIA